MSVPSLLEIQRGLKALITQKSQAPQAVVSALNPQGGEPGVRRVTVYADGYVARLTEALEEVFEAVRFVIGKDEFIGLAEAYSKEFPSKDYNLSVAGKNLSDFLAAYSLTRKVAFLPDLARLEWAVSRAFHAYQEKPVESVALAAIGEKLAGCRFVFQPSVQILRSAWPVLDIWNARKLPRNEVKVELAGRAQDVLIWREGLKTRCRILEPWEYDLLSGLLAGKTLDEACQQVIEAFPDRELPVQALFSSCITSGLFTDCRSS